VIVVVDTHVHLYRCFDPVSALSHGARNLLKHVAADEPFVCVLVLTEPHGLCCFAQLRSGEMPLAGCAVDHSADTNAIRVRGLSTPLILVSGRQIATIEGLEVLALAADEATPDGLSLAQTLSRISATGAVPVLPWSPGKWTLRRAAVVRDAISRHPSDSLLIGDSSLRPRAWPESRFMSLARSRGFRVVAGSDPLPFAGEERWIGGYAIVARGDFDPEHPALSLRRLLLSPETRVTIAGRRRPFFSVIGRITRLVATRSTGRLMNRFRMDRSSPDC
jgi:hypothetical protein